MILLFGNAFGAYATAYALTGGFINLVPIQIGAQIRGDVLHDPNLGYALALGMVVVMTLSILGYTRCRSAPPGGWHEARHEDMRLGSWLWLVLGVPVFPRPAAGARSSSPCGAKKGVLELHRLRATSSRTRSSLQTFTFSFEMAVITIVVGLALIIPTVIWVHLRVPRARALIETVRSPALCHSADRAGLRADPDVQPAALRPGHQSRAAGCRVCRPFLPLHLSRRGCGLRSIDLRGLTEAAQSLGRGLGHARCFASCCRTSGSSLLSAAFLTFSIVVGELTLAVMLAWPAFGPYMALVGRDLAYEPAALAIISFLLTWGMHRPHAGAEPGHRGRRLIGRRRPLNGSIVEWHSSSLTDVVKRFGKHAAVESSPWPWRKESSSLSLAVPAAGRPPPCA